MYSSVFAAENSSIGLDVTLDADKNRDTVLSVTYFIDEVHQLSLQLGSQTASDDAGNQGFDTRSFDLGVENMADTFINTGWEFSRWGNFDHLHIDAIRGLLAANWEKVRLEFRPQLQRIRFENVTIPNGPTQLDLTSKGGAVTVTYTINENWFVDVEYAEYKYYSTFPKLEQALDNAECKLRVGANSPLDKYRKALRLGRAQEWGSVIADYQRSRGLISGCDTDQGGLTALIELNKQWSVTVAAGSSTSPIAERLNYVSTGVSYSF